MEAKLTVSKMAVSKMAVSKMAVSRSGGFLRYFKLECSLPLSIFSGYGVADGAM